MPSKFNNKISLLALFLSAAVIIGCILTKPKWKGKYVHATISWDVSGYYIYLPAIFIYKDLEKIAFKEPIHEKYHNSGFTYQSFTHTNGNDIARYSCGMALQYLPFFLIADVLAEPLGYERDGYTMPYQAAIYFGSALMAFIGLFYLRKSLLEYFSDKSTAITLVLLVIGTNYLNYSTADAAMPHNYLFTLFSILIWNSIQWHKKPTYSRSIIIGLILGMAALIRPTEIMTGLIPILWMTYFFRKNDIGVSLKERFLFLKKHSPKLGVALITTLLLGSIQLIYWKMIGGDWVINSYQDDAQFDWLKPHLWNGFFHFRKGWLIYTPIMAFSIFGIGLMLKHKHQLSLIISLYFLVHVYVTFSWSCWWYAGSVGQRPMVQAYALLAFPLAYFIQWALAKNKRILPVAIIAVLCSYLNINLYHQAQFSGILDSTDTTQKYFFKTLGKWKKDNNDFKYLDVSEEYKGSLKNKKRIYLNDFEKDSILQTTDIENISGNNSLALLPKIDSIYSYIIPFGNEKNNKWIRVGGDFRQKIKEWSIWEMPHFYIRLLNDGVIVKQSRIHISRILNPWETKEIYIDTKIPKEGITEIEILFISKHAKYPILVDDLYIDILK